MQGGGDALDVSLTSPEGERVDLVLGGQRVQELHKLGEDILTVTLEKTSAGTHLLRFYIFSGRDDLPIAAGGWRFELSGASGFFAKAKAVAQQVALSAQTAFAENKLRGVRNAVARSILDEGREASVPNAEFVLAEIAAARTLAASAVQRLEEAKAERDEAGRAIGCVDLGPYPD